MSHFFWEHKWSLWEIDEQCDISRTVDNTITGKSILQKRTCSACGLAEYKHDKIDRV